MNINSIKNMTTSRRFSVLLLVLLLAGVCRAQVPSAAQLAWHDTEFYLFFHFGPNTFTNMEWGHGTETEDMFYPTALDCDQWCRIAKQAGAKGVIITAKHHDGFCLWPSKYSKHTVRESKWKNGQGDVLRELSDACKRHGLLFGVYLSPWDRNHPQYGTPEYNDTYANALTELMTQYGDLFEIWWDGANGEGPNGKRQVYDFHRFEQLTAAMQPNAVVFSDIGPGCRWAGNEQGTVNTTNWATLDTIGFLRGNGAPSTDTLQRGNVHGAQWIPAECDVSIRPGWFYHTEEDDKVKSPEQLWSIYTQSVGRGANLILNVPPDRRGRIHARDSAALVAFGAKKAAAFANNLVHSRKGNTVNLGAIRQFNTVVLKEDIAKGQYIAAFRVEVQEKNGWRIVARSTTVGARKFVIFDPVTAKKVRIVVEQTKDHQKSTLTRIDVFQQ
jgi:alpha-L-fucosidase